ncbi:MAG TPA: hypothetical protein DF383_01335 [Deltaproteobacteria bacterium]|nr:hypothetical protein [Deltaproteobacteria bacterium]
MEAALLELGHRRELLAPETVFRALLLRNPNKEKIHSHPMKRHKLVEALEITLSFLIPLIPT